MVDIKLMHSATLSEIESEDRGSEFKSWEQIRVSSAKGPTVKVFRKEVVLGTNTS